MQYRVDKFLPHAFEAIKQVKIKVKDKWFGLVERDETIPKAYKGYIAQLGASIIQAGVKAALTFYEAEEKGSEQDRRLVTAAIKYILTEGKKSDHKLSEWLVENDPNFEQIQQKAEAIMDAATALKLALRTYKMGD